MGDIRTNVMTCDFGAQQTWFRWVGAVCNCPSETFCHLVLREATPHFPERHVSPLSDDPGAAYEAARIHHAVRLRYVSGFGTSATRERHEQDYLRSRLPLLRTWASRFECRLLAPSRHR